MKSRLDNRGMARRPATAAAGICFAAMGALGAVCGVPGLMPTSTASAASACRPSIIVTAPSTSPIQQAVTIGVRVKPCSSNEFSGSCILEERVGTAFVSRNSSAILGDNACDFPISFNAAGSHTMRVRFTGDSWHNPAVSRTFTITFKAPSSATSDLKIGLAFVDSSVTARGHNGLPAGIPVFRPGSTITGSTGCPTDSFGQDGLMVLVFDYAGGPTSASVTTTITPLEGGSGFTVAPYYLDLNPGQSTQYLGPRDQNGTYDILVEYGYARATAFPKINVRFTLNRNCG